MRFVHSIGFVFLFILFHFTSWSQNVVSLSLEQAINLALNNSIELKNLKIDEHIQLEKNREVIGMTMPQVSGSGSLTYYANLPQFVFPTSDISVYEVLAKEGVKDGSGKSIDIQNASFGTQPISLVAPLNFQVGIDVQQILFQPDVFVAIQARKTVIEYAQKNTLLTQESVKENVEKAYYGVLISHKQKEVLIQTLNRLEQLQNEMNQMLTNGFIEKLDLDKLTVTLNNTKTSLNQLNNSIHISESLLKNALLLSQSDSLVLTDPLDSKILRSELLVLDSNFNYEDRKEISLLQTAKKIQELDLKRHKLSYAPNVAAFYQWQLSGQRNKTYDIDGSGPWFTYQSGLLGLSINQPIFDGLQKSHRIQQAKLSVEKVENTIQQLKQGIDLEQTVAKSMMDNAMLNLEIQERNISLAQSVFETTKIKYKEGQGSSIELLQADTEFQRANGGYFQALYDAAIAKTSYLKSLGKL